MQIMYPRYIPMSSYYMSQMCCLCSYIRSLAYTVLTLDGYVLYIFTITLRLEVLEDQCRFSETSRLWANDLTFLGSGHRRHDISFSLKQVIENMSISVAMEPSD